MANEWSGISVFFEGEYSSHYNLRPNLNMDGIQLGFSGAYPWKPPIGNQLATPEKIMPRQKALVMTYFQMHKRKQLEAWRKQQGFEH